MANYYDWNQAIYHYIIDGLPVGSHIFLSIDDEALIGAGRFINPVPPRHQRVIDFKRAVRARYVAGNRVRNITPLGEELNKVPSYLSFLAATVLAAYQMSEDEDVSSTNYFTRLKEVLDILDSQRRPNGLEAGIEDVLWEHWANWLTHRGYLSSAEPGEGGQKYVNYSISQTLLRQADRENLWHHFTSHKWSRNLDEDTVIARVIRDKQYLSNHLNRLLSDQKMRLARREGLYQAIYDIYDLWTNSGASGTYQAISSADRTRNLVAGLYRTFNYFNGEPEYALLPQQARRVQAEHATVTFNQQVYDLTLDRPGWYQPLWDITAQELNNGLKVNIEGAEELDKLILPTRDFWILNSDPDDPGSGIYASWGKIMLGAPFIILCKQPLQSQLNHLKSEGLINWHDTPSPIWDNEMWFEYQNVEVISEGWEGVFLEDKDLLESLQPKSSLGITFSGGLRTGQGGWLVGYGPAVTSHSFNSQADLTLVDPLSNEEIFVQRNMKTNEPLTIEWPKKAGNYLLQILSGSTRPQERFLNLIDWDKIAPAVIEHFPTAQAGGGAISGALVEI